MTNLKFNSLINLKLTQESGQTSQPPWRQNSVGNIDEELVEYIIKFYDKNPLLSKELVVPYEIDKDMRQAYKGGFTYLNPIYEEIDVGAGVVLDVNSLYPSVMYEKPLPIGDPEFYNGKYEEDAKLVFNSKIYYNYKYNFKLSIPKNLMEKIYNEYDQVEKNQNPPTFEQYLDVCKKYGMTAIIDLKYAKGVGPADEYLSPTVIKTIQDKGMMDSCVIQTNNDNDIVNVRNNHTDIPYIRQTSQDARIWYLTDVISDKNFQLIAENGVECVNVQNGDNNSYQIKKYADAGIDVCVWNVQTEAKKQRLLDQGATYVMSDNILGITPYQEGEEDFNNIAK